MADMWWRALVDVSGNKKGNVAGSSSVVGREKRVTMAWGKGVTCTDHTLKAVSKLVF